MRLFSAESTNARQRQLEGRAIHPVERVGDFVGDMTLDIAEEAQGKMVVLDVDPAGSGQTATEQR